MFVRRLTTKSPSAAAASAGMGRALHEVGTKSRPKCGGGQVAGRGEWYVPVAIAGMKMP